MTSTITHSPVVPRAALLIRRVGGVELPAAGTWNVPGSHADIGFSVSRRLRRTERWRGRAVAVTIVVGDDPDDLLVAVVLDAGLATITARSGGSAGSGGCLVARTDTGPLSWAVSGDAHVNGAVLPVCAILSYHGVWKHGDWAYGWFTLAGALASRRAGGRRSVRFSFDLLADGPRVESAVA
jgi:hypothetical protein